MTVLWYCPGLALLNLHSMQQCPLSQSSTRWLGWSVSRVACAMFCCLPLRQQGRAVWLLVGHTHSESPAGVSGLSRLPSPVLSRWVVTIVTGPGTKVRRTFVTATYFNRLLATSTRILATLSCTSSKIAAAISDCRILDFSSSKIATSSIANCCS